MAKNLQQGEHIVDLALVEGEQSSANLSPASVGVQDDTLGRNENDARLQHEARPTDEHRCVSSSEEISDQDPSRPRHRSGLVEEVLHRFTTPRNELAQPSSEEVDHQDRPQHLSQSIEGFFRQFTTPRSILSQPSSDRMDGHSHQQNLCMISSQSSPSSGPHGMDIDPDRMDVVELGEAATTQ
jgi:hypothetical protein